MRKCKFTQVMNTLEATNIRLLNGIHFLLGRKPAPYFPHFIRQLGIPDFGFPFGNSLHHPRRPLQAEIKV
jgi:hypothetical protein